MIRDVLPAGVAAAEAFEDPDDVALFAAERAAIARAVPRRRQEFATVRRCARSALAELGHPPVPLLPGIRGAPQWPAGVVGSMTHCPGYRAAAVAPSDRVLALGIDAEPDEPLPDGVLRTVALAEETAHLAELAAAARYRDDPRDGSDGFRNGPDHPGDDPGDPGDGRSGRLPRSWERLLFSCKESVFKAWYPLTGRELGFDQASIRFHPAAGTFCARLLADPGIPALPRQLHGRWTAQRHLLVSAIVVPAPDLAPPAP